MTSYVRTGIAAIEMFANYEITGIDNLYTWFRSLNTQEWLGPFISIGNANINKRYTQWFVDTSSIPDFEDQHRNGFYQFCTTVAIPGLPAPTVGVQNQGIIKLIFSPGGEINKVEYVSNNEQREADTYFRPNY